MTEEMNGKLRLTAMTLRGIGSYLHGARLDIRPLTVLCGKNGSGKSTWLQVLDMLRTWCFEGEFPFRGLWRLSGVGPWRGEGPWKDDRDLRSHDFTNAYVKDCVAQDPVIAGEPSDDEKFGPPGTIGLHFVVGESFTLPPMRDVRLWTPSVAARTIAQSMLWKGQCLKGTKFRLRLALPTTRANARVWGELIQLSIDGVHNVEYRCPPGTPLESDKTIYTLACSSSFIPDGDEDESATVPILRLLTTD